MTYAVWIAILVVLIAVIPPIIKKSRETKAQDRAEQGARSRSDDA